VTIAGNEPVSIGESLPSLSEQQPTHEVLQLHWPLGQLHWPPQHSSFGRLTNPNPKDCEPGDLAELGYMVVFIGSKWYDEAIIRCAGGGGRAAALAKKRSKKVDDPAPANPAGCEDDPALEVDGRVIPRLGSTHVPQPSAQFLLSWFALSLPLCSTHPGQAHCTPHVHPDPAREVISLMGGGMKAKSGTAVGIADEEELEDGVYKIGARSGPEEGIGVRLFSCRARFRDACVGLPGLERGRVDFFRGEEGDDA